MIHGFLLIDKPKDWTSHDVVGYLRKITGEKRIGHAGTLDPFATGLLIVGVGREATKRLDEFKRLTKTYLATIRLGAVSDTDDKTGIITQCLKPAGDISLNKVTETVKKFVGKQKQIPSMYSAKKVKGKKLYELARKGIEIERTPVDIEIFDITIEQFDFPLLTLTVSCSCGTYIRTLAHDIGEALGVGAYCEELQRTRIGTFDVRNASSLKTSPQGELILFSL